MDGRCIYCFAMDLHNTIARWNDEQKEANDTRCMRIQMDTTPIPKMRCISLQRMSMRVYASEATSAY